MEYGVLVNNKFALFDSEDEDPLEVLQRTQDAAAAAVEQNKSSKENPRRAAGGKAKLAAKNAKNAVKTESKPTGKVLIAVQEQKLKTATSNVGQRSRDVPEKPPRFRQNENTQRRTRDDDVNRPDTDFRTERIELRSSEDNAGSRGSGPVRRGRGAAGGGRSAGGTDNTGFNRFGKREFERHSGSDRTGLKPVEKRDGAGAHNWGTIADAVAEQEQVALNQSGVEQTFDMAAAAANANTGEEMDRAGDAEAEDDDESRPQLTLDEWKALQAGQRAKTTLKLRKPGEGCQNSQWKHAVVLKKKLDDRGDDDDDEYEEDDDAGRGRQRATTVPIAIRFNDSGSTRGTGGPGRRGQGGRGRGGGRGQSGGGRGQADFAGRSVVETVPNVDNEQDFPSLA